jgi:predicted DCC family thiol-disulfide oxidoreductase YuxK
VYSEAGVSAIVRHGLSREACLDAMRVIAPDGRVTAGFDGVRTIAWLLPAMWCVAPFLYFPGAAPLGRRLYGHVAASRSTVCSIDEAGPGSSGRTASR